MLVFKQLSCCLWNHRLGNRNSLCGGVFLYIPALQIQHHLLSSAMWSVLLCPWNSCFECMCCCMSHASWVCGMENPFPYQLGHPSCLKPVLHWPVVGSIFQRISFFFKRCCSYCRHCGNRGVLSKGKQLSTLLQYPLTWFTICYHIWIPWKELVQS